MHPPGAARRPGHLSRLAVAQGCLILSKHVEMTTRDVSVRPMSRVLILTASIGEGHDLPARTLAAQIAAEEPAAEVIVQEAPGVWGKPFGIAEGVSGVIFYRALWLYDLVFWLVAGGPLHRLARWLSVKFGGT